MFNNLPTENNLKIDSNHSSSCDGVWEIMEEKNITKRECHPNYPFFMGRCEDVEVKIVYIQKCNKCGYIRSLEVDLR